MKEVKWSRLLRYTPENVGKITQDAGIYVIYVQYKNGYWGPIYAGRAKNLRRRLSDHLKDSEENDCLKQHVKEYTLGFVAAIVKSQKSRAAYEKYLIVEFEPECNVLPEDVIQINLARV